MNRKILLSLFLVLMLIAQWLIPYKMIWTNDRTVKEGKVFKFKTMPIDPSDAFRGKFIHLNYDNTLFCLADNKSYKQAQEVFVSIDNDSLGYAKITAISHIKPSNPNYIVANINYIQQLEEDSSCIDINFPFDRYYMEESKSKDAEDLYRKSIRHFTKNVYSVVYIKDGNAVLTDVKIDDKSIKDLIPKK